MRWKLPLGKMAGVKVRHHYQKNMQLRGLNLDGFEKRRVEKSCARQRVQVLLQHARMSDMKLLVWLGNLSASRLQLLE